MTGKASAAKKAARLPKLFPLSIPERRFQAAILKRIFTTGDRDYILGMYRLEQDGTRVRGGEVGEKDAKRLADLAKSIARNRGLVQVPRLVILAVIVTAAILFNIFFKNALLTRALEAGLESVFGARAEVAGLDFRVIGGSMSIRRLAVADRDRPMRNLFELGRTEISIDTPRLLEGRIHVRNLECRDVRWDTARATSGALAQGGQAAEEAPSEAAPSAPSGESGLKMAAASLLQGLDIPALLDEQAASLSSAAKLQAANERLTGLSDTWSAAQEKSRMELETLSARIEEIRRFDYASVSSLKDARKLLEAIQAASPAVKSLTSNLATAAKQISADVKSVQAEQAGLQKSITADVATLKTSLKHSGGGWKSLASTLASRVLQRYLGKYYGWVIKAKDAGFALIQQKRGGKKARPLSRQGRLVVFPGASFPRFLLSKAGLSISPQSGLPGIEASVKDITSDPDILDRPITLQASAKQDRQAISLAVTIDPRAKRKNDAEVSLGAENWDLSLQEGLQSLSIGSLAATAGLETGFRLLPGGGAIGEGSIALRSMVMQPLSAGDPIGAAIGQALASVPTARVDFSFTMASRGEPAAVVVQTNLDEVLSKAVSTQAGRLASQYEGKLREELTRRLEMELKKNEALASGLAELRKAAGADLATAGSYGKVLEDAQKELEKRLKTAIPLPKLGF